MTRIFKITQQTQHHLRAFSDFLIATYKLISFSRKQFDCGGPNSTPMLRMPNLIKKYRGRPLDELIRIIYLGKWTRLNYQSGALTKQIRKFGNSLILCPIENFYIISMYFSLISCSTIVCEIWSLWDKFPFKKTIC